MLHLEFAAIHLEDVLFAAVQHFSQGLHGFGFARAGRSQQQEHPHRPAFRRQTRLKHLDVWNDYAGGGGLAYNFLR